MEIEQKFITKTYVDGIGCVGIDRRNDQDYKILQLMLLKSEH